MYCAWNGHFIANDFFLGPFGKAIKLIEKMIMALKDRPNMFHRIEFLPMLTEVLLQSEIRTEHTLKLIQDVSFGIPIKSHQSYLERLIKFCVDILCSETNEVSDKKLSYKKPSIRLMCSQYVITA